jgi:hypothetical protein
VPSSSSSVPSERFQESSSQVWFIFRKSSFRYLPFTVPNPVLGGVTTFLFGSVIVSGLRVLSFVKYTRRDRFILAAALSFGAGDLIMPDIFTHLFDGVKNPNNGLQGLFESITIVLSTPCEWTCFTLSLSLDTDVIDGSFDIWPCCLVTELVAPGGWVTAG